MKKSIAFLLILAVSGQVKASKKLEDVIYGEDNRKDVFESTNSALVELSRSTAAMIGPQNLTDIGNGEVEISGSTFQQYRNMCSKERFSKQLASSYCSGFLVAENLLVTAGHCVTTNSDCQSQLWVFDYKVDSSDQLNIRVPATSVFGCKKLLSRTLDPISKNDYAVIELDRNVVDRRPLSFRKEGRMAIGTPVAVIGNPSGLPTKIADGAKVRSFSDKFFVANLDAFGGNSGSAVFNLETYEVEGILVRGEEDYVFDERLRCNVSNKCADSECRGEDVTYITNIPELGPLP